MYKIFTSNSKAKKNLRKYVQMRKDVAKKLDRLKANPRTVLGAHPLHGRLAGKWGCWLGVNIRIVYSIDEKDKLIVIEGVGSHKIY